MPPEELLDGTEVFPFKIFDIDISRVAVIGIDWLNQYPYRLLPIRAVCTCEPGTATDQNQDVEEDYNAKTPKHDVKFIQRWLRMLGIY